MDRFKARPLQSLTLSSRPLSPHALAWSCDAELAVATAECIYIFLPEYLADKDDNADERDISQYQFTLSLQPSAVINPNPAINAQICAHAGVRIPPPQADEESGFRGVGNGAVTGSGAALGQVIRVEWSPNGLGCNLRPVLMALTTHGSVVTFGEHIDRRSTITSSMRARSFKNWKTLWGLGAKLPVPDDECEDGFRNMDERIVSFSWAREIAPGRALLAYANDAGEVVVMSIQYFPLEQASKRASEEESVWDVLELARFDGNGPHGATDPADPDFIPHGSIFSLKWSPWLMGEGYQTATLAYLAKNHIGFRRITIHGEWNKGHTPDVEVEQSDTTGICLFLSSDAFVEWEDTVWTEDDAQVGRGVIATPFVVKPFQVALNGALNEPTPQHSPWECSATYSQDDEMSTNPITGLVIHHPDPNNKPAFPHYSLIRLSATATNQDWYQTTLPSETTPLPQWAEDIGDQTARLVSRAAALDGVDSDFDSDSEDGGGGGGAEEKAVSSTTISAAAGDNIITAAATPRIEVHPHRFRLWGLALSPGHGCTAILASKHSTQHPDRRGLSSVHFDWQVPEAADTNDEHSEPPRAVVARPLVTTTEGRVWEWMYGLGEDVPGVTTVSGTRSGHHHHQQQQQQQQQHSPLRELFKDVALQLPCVFCGAKLRIEHAGEATCENNHPFATCAASGIPIMAPGISRVCAVCKLRCLKVTELERLAQEHFGSSEAVGGSSGEVCGACGGKFVV